MKAFRNSVLICGGIGAMILGSFQLSTILGWACVIAAGLGSTMAGTILSDEP